MVVNLEFHLAQFECDRLCFTYFVNHLTCFNQGMQVLVDARDKLEIPWEQANSNLAATEAIKFRSNNELDVATFRDYAPIIRCLWQDAAIKKAYDKRREFQLVSIRINYSS